MLLSNLEAMRLAIKEGEWGLGRVHPNPPVGCVVLDSTGRLLVTGRHEKFGGEHAEINALNKISDTSKIKNSVWFVTLEPCAHEGKTPSCAKKLATLPIKKVYYGLVDPNPDVSGKGIEILQKAGIQTEKFSELEDELEALPEIFLYNMRFKKTFVAVKVASTLDGQLAHVSGESQWITGEAARHHAHYLRAQYDAIAIGGRTLTVDNPKLNIRHPDFNSKNQKVVIFDSAGKAFSKDLNIFKVHNPKNIYWITRVDCPNEKLIPELNWLKADDEGMALSELYNLGVKSILIEGGASLISRFLAKKLVNRYYQFIAPSLLGAESGISITRELNVPSFSERILLKKASYKTFGEDLLFSAKL